MDDTKKSVLSSHSIDEHGCVLRYWGHRKVDRQDVHALRDHHNLVDHPVHPMGSEQAV